jgi:hypothetical protein
MSSIRFKKRNEPALPVTDHSSLYVDQADNHLKRKKEDGTIVDYDTAASAESVEDIIGAILTDTATIDFTYDDATPAISADVKPSSLDDTQIIKLSPTKIEDANFTHKHYTVTTSNATPTVIRTESLVTDGVYLFEARITGLRLSGAGSPGDSATFIRTFRIKLNGGNASLGGLQSDFTWI